MANVFVNAAIHGYKGPKGPFSTVEIQFTSAILSRVSSDYLARYASVKLSTFSLCTQLTSLPLLDSAIEVVSVEYLQILLSWNNR